MAESEFVFVYSTFPDAEIAHTIGRALVEQKLAACVNIQAPMTSVYRWQGRVETAMEVAAFIKTRRILVDRVIAAARPLHPYSVPCFLVLPIASGNDDYLAWVRAETSQE